MTEERMLQVLSTEGRLNTADLAEEYQPYLDRVTPELLQQFYQQMMEVRAFDDEAYALQRQGQLGLWVPIKGQEGGQIGVAHALRPQDMVFPSYREHAIGHVRGLDMTRITRIFRGLSHGGWNPTDHNFQPYTLVIGSQALHATGYAMGVNFDGATSTGSPDRDTAVLACYGDGATSQGDTSEAFVFAASYQAPVVFFVQNNHWAISVPVHVQSRVPLYLRSRGFGVPSVQIDGNDVIAGFLAGSYWLDQAREGKGPSMIESKTFRMGAHTSSDDPSRYQAKELFESWREKDPILRLERYLRGEGLAEEFFTDTAARARDFASDIRKRTLELEAPSVTSIFRNVYAEEHPVTQEQEEWLKAYEAAFGEEL